MNTVEQQREAQITITGAVSGRYVIRERREGGELVIAPDTSWPAMLERMGGRDLTEQEWADFIAEYGPSMLPPDGEG